jgi:hypothetical protein
MGIHDSRIRPVCRTYLFLAELSVLTPGVKGFPPLAPRSNESRGARIAQPRAGPPSGGDDSRSFQELALRAGEEVALSLRMAPPSRAIESRIGFTRHSRAPQKPPLAATCLIAFFGEGAVHGTILEGTSEFPPRSALIPLLVSPISSLTSEVRSFKET